MKSSSTTTEICVKSAGQNTIYYTLFPSIEWSYYATLYFNNRNIITLIIHAKSAVSWKPKPNVKIFDPESDAIHFSQAALNKYYYHPMAT